jgi:hypothetical protein
LTMSAGEEQLQPSNENNSLKDNVEKSNRDNNIRKNPPKIVTYIKQRIQFLQRLIKVILFGKNGLRNSTEAGTAAKVWVRRNRNNREPLLKRIARSLKEILRTPIGKIGFFISGCLLYISFKALMTSSASLIHEVAFSQFLELVQTKPELLERIRVTPGLIFFGLAGQQCKTRIVDLPLPLYETLVSAKVPFAAYAPPKSILSFFGSILYLFILWQITSRSMQGPQDDGAGKSRESLELQRFGQLSFDDIAGQEAAKLEVKEICDMLKEPSRYLAVGARLPSGVLLVGPPGSGKTLLARVTAAEANVPFYACSASDFVEIFVGRGPARVRKLFQRAAENAPSIVFIDELDSIGRSRKMGSLNSEQESTLNQVCCFQTKPFSFLSIFISFFLVLVINMYGWFGYFTKWCDCYGSNQSIRIIR